MYLLVGISDLLASSEKHSTSVFVYRPSEYGLSPLSYNDCDILNDKQDVVVVGFCKLSANKNKMI